jgi:hypothetical protein
MATGGGAATPRTVSTRRVEKLVLTLGITVLSKSRVSEMTKDLDSQVEVLRTRVRRRPVHLRCRRCVVLKVREAGGRTSPSSLLCKAAWVLVTGRGCFGRVDEGESGEGLLPSGGDLAFDETFFGFAFGAAAEAGSLARSRARLSSRCR